MMQSEQTSLQTGQHEEPGCGLKKKDDESTSSFICRYHKQRLSLFPDGYIN